MHFSIHSFKIRLNSFLFLIYKVLTLDSIQAMNKLINFEKWIVSGDAILIVSLSNNWTIYLDAEFRMIYTQE